MPHRKEGLKIGSRPDFETRKELKAHSPKIIKLRIAKDFIGAVIGPGGKVIQKMQEETETTIVINEIEETGEGEIEILGTNQEGIDKALETIHSICFVPKVDEIYKGVVKSISLIISDLVILSYMVIYTLV